MKISDAYSKVDFKKLNTEELRNNFAFQLFENDKVNSVYTYYDRVILFGVKPVSKTLDISDGEFIHAKYLLENREIGIVNIGGNGTVNVDGTDYKVSKNEALYVGKGSEKIKMSSTSKGDPALFYCFSAPAHATFPTKLIDLATAKKVALGDEANLNKRTIYQLIHPNVLETCQISMGVTILEKGSVWNTCPPHTHDRRMEAYVYFEIPNPDIVIHVMGEKEETRHVILRNNEAIINPPWSLHFGTATKNYSFVWSMAGENKTFDDMDHVGLDELK